jgi:hypothetical protein
VNFSPDSNIQLLGVEIVLDTREAFFGVSVPIEVPVYVRCSRCGGGGGEWGVCPLCHGYGMMEISHSVRLEIPPEARSGDRYQLDLEERGNREPGARREDCRCVRKRQRI